MINETSKIQKFDYVKAIADQNNIEVIISQNEFIIQKTRVLHRCESVDELYGYIFGYIKGLQK